MANSTSQTCSKAVTDADTMIWIVVVAFLVSIVLLAVNIFIMLFLKKKLVVETERVMMKCLELMDHVLLVLMPLTIQAQLQAIKGPEKPAETCQQINETDPLLGESAIAATPDTPAWNRYIEEGATRPRCDNETLMELDVSFGSFVAQPTQSERSIVDLDKKD